MQALIQITNTITLTKSSRADKPAIIKYLNDIEISETTLRIPYPYYDRDADDWLNYILAFELENNIQKNWVIRNEASELIGGIGLHYPYGFHSYNNEIYYWLAKPYWNKGIMTTTIKKFCEHCFTNLKFERLEAPIFDFNIASEIILKKNGFELEKILPNHYEKAGKLISAKMYVKTNAGL